MPFRVASILRRKCHVSLEPCRAVAGFVCARLREGRRGNVRLSTPQARPVRAQRLLRKSAKKASTETSERKGDREDVPKGDS